MIITIDGPSASGKTSIARMLAQQLNFYYISSGMLFRGLAYILVHEFRYSSESLLHARSEDVKTALHPERLVYHYSKENAEQLFYDGVNISNQLRDKKITEYASQLATQEIVRDALVQLQHRIADHHDIIVEGRDTGSIIFPQAAVKFYLTASLTVRAQRWYSDQKAKGRDLSLETAHAEVQKRDERDMNRAIAPLVIPQKAVIVDDSNLSKEKVITLMLEHIKSAHQNR